MQVYFGRTSAYIFALGCHLGFGNCGGLGQENISRGSRRELEKNAPPLCQSFTGQAAKMVASQTLFTI